MAANRFATMLHRRTNRITVILVYVLLEWVLILLLFLNSIFSHLIIKFAKFFGLKPPCFWCTGIDHIIDPANGNKNLHRDLLCEVHGKEVSRLGFCTVHGKLAESQDFCHDCLFSMPEFACFSRITKDFRVTPNDEVVGENGDPSLNCSCCGVNLLSQKNSPIKTSPDPEFAQHVTLFSEEGDHGIGSLLLPDADKQQAGSAAYAGDGERSSEETNLERMDNWLKELGEDTISEEKNECVHVSEEASPAQSLDYFLDHTGRELVPVEQEQKIEENAFTKCEDEEAGNRELTPGSDVEVENRETSLAFPAKDSLVNDSEGLEGFPLAHWPSMEESDAQEPEEEHLDTLAESEETGQVHTENEADISIGTEIPDLDMADEVPIKVSLHTEESSEVVKPGPEEVQEGTVELQTLSVTCEAPRPLEPPEAEEDKAPETPASMDSFTPLHKKMIFLEKQYSWAEESLDGSVTSELEIGDGVVSIESLKSVLRTERKALKALYAELEEERSASEVAASQSMAMINRLQEEKAAMQMEALQYQRMMEEQSEYDQEALQLLNELMVKREKEKQELERELEECRKKLSDFESKDKAKVLKISSSLSSSSDSDEQEEEEEEVGNQDSVEGTPCNEDIKMKESLPDFEEERLSILEQLKVLEQKLFMNGDDSVHANGSLNSTDHHKRIRASGHNGKSLLPLFDAISDESGDEMVHVNGNGVHYSPKLEFETAGNSKNSYEEEMCNLHERLEALEEDKEFVKHCISSLKQGDRRLLQEILQYLRDLRNVELQARTTSTDMISDTRQDC